MVHLPQVLTTAHSLSNLHQLVDLPHLHHVLPLPLSLLPKPLLIHLVDLPDVLVQSLSDGSAMVDLVILWMLARMYVLDVCFFAASLEN